MNSDLEGNRVLDLTDEKGSLCGKIFGDLGADVIKVEPPGGCSSRNLGPFFHDIPHPEKSLYFFAYNNNKRSITLDIESRTGKELFRELVKASHFVIESFKPDYLTSLGLEYRELTKVNPSIVVVSITPFGTSGPYKDLRGSDLTISAMSSLMYTFGDTDRAPLRLSVDQSYCYGGVAGAIGGLLAHYYRESTGEGQHVDASMQEIMAWLTMFSSPRWMFDRYLMKRAGQHRAHKRTNLRMIYPCKDGHISFFIGMSNLSGPSEATLVKIMREEGIGDKSMESVDWKSMDFDTMDKEDHDRWEQYHIEFFKRHTKAELLQLLKEKGVLLSPVQDPRDVVENEQLEARDFWQEIEHPELGETIKYPGAFCNTSINQPEIRRRPPLIGEHNEEIYMGELGLSRKELSILKTTGVV
jgi:benzylsuccinate CoA-transferase BbsE subunit